jgi:glucose/arabinose dehydrogenase
MRCKTWAIEWQWIASATTWTDRCPERAGVRGPVLRFVTAFAALLAPLSACTPAQAQPDPDAGNVDEAVQAPSNPLPDPERSNLGLVLEKFVTLPGSKPTSGIVTDGRLMRHNRINHLSELPDGSARLAVPDLNGSLYLLEDDGRYVEYLNLNDRFPDIHNHAGLGTGLGFVAFHPKFGENGTFYTVHTESGHALSDRESDFPEFGKAVTQSVITKWVADDPDANRFSGTSTEMMRIAFGGWIHTVQQIGFNPTAEEGDPDYGLLYLLIGDGGNGIGSDNPQDPSTPHGTIFRIDPMGTNGRTGEYGIPDDNPFLDVPGALPEIYAIGLRDPHRMSWDPGGDNRMFLGHIGESQIESVYEVRPGDNFGWPRREGPFLMRNGGLYPLPPDDDRFGFTYPVAAYDHTRDPGRAGAAGSAIGGGFVYRGDIELLKGRYIFTDIVRGYVFTTRAGQMQRDEARATIEQLRLYIDGRETTFAELNADDDPDDGDDNRIDLRVARDAEGELYLLSKGSGTIWRIVDAVVDPPRDNANVVRGLADNLVAYYDFDHPSESDASVETDRGLSGTRIELVNGGAAMRVGDDPAYPGAGNALQTRSIEGSNNDWKAGIYDTDGVPSLGAFNETDAISIAGWFEQTGQNPSPGYGAIGLAGVLSGTSEGHLVRALLEVFEVGGELRLVALGRRIDDGSSWVFAANAPWDELLPPEVWVHLAATFDFDSGEMRLYANGEALEGSYTAGGDPWGVDSGDGPHFSSPSDPAGIKIGGSFPQNTAERNPCNCRMDDLMFLDRVVTPEEIRMQYARF